MKEKHVHKIKHHVKKIEQIVGTKTTAFLQVLQFLAKNPFTSFSASEVAVELGLSRSTTTKILEALQSENLVIIGKITPRLWRVQFNGADLRAIGAKIALNIGAIYKSNIVEYIKQKWGPPKAIVLFGSVRKGEDGPSSDIDIAVEIDKEAELAILELATTKEEETSVLKELHKTLIDFENVFGRKFKFHFFHRNKVDNNLFNNIVNGILLWGFLEAKP